MASDVTGGSSGIGHEPSDITKPDVSPIDRPLVAPPAGVSSAPHRPRFFVIYGILGLALAAAVAGIVVYAGRSINPGPSWSSWKPSGGGLGAVHQIADHVAPAYRLPDGNQLVDVIPKGPVVTAAGQSIPIPLLALRGPKGKILPDTLVQGLNPDNTLTFSMCGLGQACAIATGKPSVERAVLVRREILELALYTFKYVPSVQRIVAFMPPPTGTPPTYVLYLQKDDLKRQLQTPLAQTIKGKTPLPAQITAGEQQKIDSLTLSKVYKFGLSQTQQGEAVLVLQPQKA
jgi:hypothetical protein